MAQYFEDWSESAVSDDPPAGWTKRWDVGTAFIVESHASAPAGKCTRVAPGSANRWALSWDEIDADGDRATVDMISLIEVTEAGASSAASYGGLMARGSGTSTTETGKVGMVGNASGVGTEDIRINVYNSSAVTTTQDDVQDTWVINTLYWLRVTFSGDDTTVRLYSENDAFGTPLAEFTNSNANASAAGWVGLFGFASTGTIKYLCVGVGTNGDLPPTSGAYRDNLFTYDTVALVTERSISISDGLYMYDASSGEVSGAGGGGPVVSTVAITDGLLFTEVASLQSRGVRIPLHNGSTPSTSVNSLTAYWWDTDVNSLGAPLANLPAITTDANSGYARINLEAVTQKNPGELGVLFLHKKETDPTSSRSFISQVSLQNLV